MRTQENSKEGKRTDEEREYEVKNEEEEKLRKRE